MKNTGIEYEKFVQQLIQAIIDSENLGNQKNIKVEHDIKLIDTSGIERQFDVYWEYELGGFVYKNVIECKNYTQKISIDKIDALAGKLNDLPGVNGAFATTKGYQKGAIKKALSKNIELLLIREQNETDWISDKGEHLIKKLILNIHICFPPEITYFSPILDKDWILENTDLNLADVKDLVVNIDETYIEETENCKKYSLKDLFNTIYPPIEKIGSELEIKETFNNAYIFIPNYPKLKLNGYVMRYINKPVNHSQTIIDKSKMLRGVVEYILKGEKRKVFDNGVVYKEKKSFKNNKKK